MVFGSRSSDGFEVIVEVACDALMQMYHVLASHVVSLSGVYEVVGLRAGIGGGAEEGQTVLQYAGGIVVANDDLQAAFEISCLFQKIGTFVTFGIFLWRIHVAFAVHYLIEFPVDDRAAGYACLEHIGIGTHVAMKPPKDQP